MEHTEERILAYQLATPIGQEKFKEVKNPEIDPQTSVLVFHGTPNPEHVEDPVIVDNWR